jgi:hypothetical protein
MITTEQFSSCHMQDRLGVTKSEILSSRLCCCASLEFQRNIPVPFSDQHVSSCSASRKATQHCMGKLEYAFES